MEQPETPSQRHQKIPIPPAISNRLVFTNPATFRLWRREEQLPPPSEDKLYSELWRLAGAATSGNNAALAQVVEFAHFLCGVLEQVAPDRLKPLAATRPTWPVRLSPLDKEVRRTVERIQQLGLGENDVFPSYAGRKIDPENLWAEYAESVLWTLMLAGEETRRVKAELSKILPEPQRFEYKGTPKNQRTVYKLVWWELPDNAIVLLHGWQELAGSLPPRITRAPECLKAYKVAAKLAILNFWAQHPAAESEAFQQADKKGYPTMKTEGALRDGAWKAIEQALEQFAAK